MAVRIYKRSLSQMLHFINTSIIPFVLRLDLDLI